MWISRLGKLAALFVGTSFFFANSSVQGQDNPANAPSQPPVTLRIVGSTVKNHKREVLGHVENVVLNPDTGQIEFAMVLADYPQNTALATAVPWFLLRHVSDQGQKGGLPGAMQVFQLNIERGNFAKAPAVNQSQWGLLGQPDWRRNVYGFYGIFPLNANVQNNAVVRSQDIPIANASPAMVFEPSPTYYVSLGGNYFDYSSGGGYGYGGYDGYYGSGNGTWRGVPFLYPDSARSDRRNRNVGRFSPLDANAFFPFDPNGTMYTASRDYLPGADVRLSPNFATGSQRTTINPASGLSSQNAQQAIPVSPGQPWSVTLPAGTKTGVPQSPGSAWSILVPQNLQQAVPVSPGQPWSVTLPAGTRTGAPANPGASWSVMLPANTPQAVPLNPGQPWSVTVPAGNPANVARGSGAWSPVIPAPQGNPRMMSRRMNFAGDPGMGFQGPQMPPPRIPPPGRGIAPFAPMSQPAPFAGMAPQAAFAGPARAASAPKTGPSAAGGRHK